MSFAPGFVLVDKAAGWTSHDVVAKARTIFAIRKIGHAGTLDPMATGLLVLGLGAATRLLRFITDQPKEYLVTALFGVATDTLDADGNVLDQKPMDIQADDVSGVVAGFLGDIRQVPPMFSAVRVGGKRLHDLARRGQEIERPARLVRVDRMVVERFEPGPYPRVRFRVVGGRGLYVRVLVDDVARELGGRAHLTSLRRVRNGVLSVDNATGIDRMVELHREDRLDQVILTPSDGLAHLPRLDVPRSLVGAVTNGRRLPAEVVGPGVADGPVRMVSESRMLALYRVEGPRVLPEVVLP